MADLKSILAEKAKNLENVPDIFLNKVQLEQKKIFSDLLMLIDKLKRDAAGKIIFNSADLSNLTLITQITDDFKKVLLNGDYINAVDAFAQEFDKQAEVTDKYFKEAFPDFSPGEAADATLAIAKQSAVELLIGEPLDANFIYPIKGLLQDAVTSGASWGETVQAIRDFVEGNEEADGRLLQYAKQIAHDEYSIADRSYVNAVADEIDAQWYLWSGGSLPATRCFCRERLQKYFHYKEIQAWGRGENLGDCDMGDGTWAGEREGTNEDTIFQNAGGYHCEHVPMPVSVFSVPKDVIQRNIDNGNFVPTDKEAEELGI